MAFNNKHRNKYGNVRYGGYASKKEYRRACELKVLEKKGLINYLREQETFELIPAQRDKSGTLLERSCCYKADFVYNDIDGNLIVEDTKGVRTKEYIIKRKLMLNIYGIQIKEI